MDEVALLLQKPRKSVVPLWEVQLVLGKNAKEDSRMLAEGLSSPPPEFQVSFQRSHDDFTEAFSRLLLGYQEVVKGFVSFTKDERVIPFISRSRYDLLMVMEEAESSRAKRKDTWPDVMSLVCEYAPYRTTVDYLNRALEATLSEVEGLTVVSA